MPDFSKSPPELLERFEATCFESEPLLASRAVVFFRAMNISR